MAGTRSNTIVGESTLLSFQFLKNKLPYDANSIIGVNIHTDYEEAQNNINIKQSIGGSSVSTIGTGFYKYTAEDSSSAGTYFDKIFIKPEADSNNVIDFINPFYVRKESYGGTAPGGMENTRIILNIFDAVGNAQAGDKVYVEMNEPWALYGKNLIQREREEFCADNDGIVEMYLLETETMTIDTGKDIYYTLNVQGTDYEKRFTIPAGTIDTDLADLPDYTGLTC